MYKSIYTGLLFCFLQSLTSCSSQPGEKDKAEIMYTSTPYELGQECGKEILLKCGQGNGNIEAACGFEIIQKYITLHKTRHFTKEEKDQFYSALKSYSKEHGSLQ